MPRSRTFSTISQAFERACRSSGAFVRFRPGTCRLNVSPLRTIRTNSSPVPGTGDPQSFTLDLPTTVQAQRREPYAKPRIRTIVVPRPAEVQVVDKVIVWYGVRRSS